MKILILMITITCSFGGGYQNPSAIKVVESPEQAAIFIYDDRPLSFQVEPDQKQYTLYEIDLVSKSIIEIDIPKLIFQSEIKN